MKVFSWKVKSISKGSSNTGPKTHSWRGDKLEKILFLTKMVYRGIIMFSFNLKTKFSGETTERPL